MPCTRLLILLLLAASGLFGLTGCGSSMNSEYLNVPQEPVTKPGAYRMTQLSQKPPVYLLHILPGERELFLTVVRECTVAENLPLAAATRQALVGFESLEALSQKPVVLGGMQAHYGLYRAVLDAAPLLLGVYSMRSEKCLLQINCWRELNTADKQIADDVRTQFERDIEPLWEFLEPKLSSHFDDQYRADS